MILQVSICNYKHANQHLEGQTIFLINIPFAQNHINLHASSLPVTKWSFAELTVDPILTLGHTMMTCKTCLKMIENDMGGAVL